MADIAWFFIGRRYGHHVLRILCKLSLEPTVCVRKTQDSFGRSGDATLMFAKFVPGLATLAPPVAGQNGMPLGRFLFFDGIGATLWVGALLGAGRLLRRRAQARPQCCSTGSDAFPARSLLLAIVGFFLARLWRRRSSSCASWWSPAWSPTN